jgi:hypothetical protein
MTPATGSAVEPDDRPALSAAERLGQIEVDTFCIGCHYNLHGQAVSVDERLGFPVCRCPECGRFHPAGVGVSASSVWTRRLATVLLLNWVGVVMAGTLAICFFLGVLSASTVGIYSNYVQVTADGREVEYRGSMNGGFLPYIKGTNTPAGPVTLAQQLQPIFPSDAERAAADAAGGSPRAWEHALGPGPQAWLWVTAGSLVLGTLAGGLCVTLLWHWPRRRYAWALVVPLVPAAVLLAVYASNAGFQLIRGQAAGRALVQLAIQALGVLIGVRVGRPVARALVRTIIPPKPRQALAFLWQVDGKPLSA